MYDVSDIVLTTEKPSIARSAVSYHIMVKHTGGYSTQDIAGVIVPEYWSLCTKAGLNPVMVIAQMCHETAYLSSWWSQRPRRNPAGIGVTGKKRATKPASGRWAYSSDRHAWMEGCSFTEWAGQSIPAHIGRLLAYALKQEDLNADQRAMVDLALAYRPLPETYRGTVRTWRDLNGRWAVPGTTYASRIAAVARYLATPQ